MDAETPTFAAPLKRWSIKTRVRLALAGLLLLIIPQIGLTVYYLVELQTQSAVFSNLTHYVIDLGVARSASEDLVLAEAPNPADRRRFLDAANRATTLAAALGSATTQSKGIAVDITRIRQGVEAARNAGLEWFDAPHPDELPERSERFDNARGDLGGRFDEALVNAYDRLRGEQDYVERVVRHADRNLIALTMITFVFVIALVVMLPTRIVSPLTRLTNAVRTAGPVTELPAIEAPDEETAALVEAFRETMARMRELDTLKRDRIVEDSAKIRVLLEGLDASAILTTGFVVDASSAAFDRLIGLTPDDVDTSLPDLMSAGGDALRRVLVRAMQTREPIRDLAVILTPADGCERTLRCNVELCRDRGRTTHLLMSLRESGSPPTRGE